MVFEFLIYLLLIFDYQNLVSAHNVEEWIPHEVTYQVERPRLRKATNLVAVDIDLTTPSRLKSYRVTCETSDDVDPTARVYTQDEILLDTVSLANIDDACSKTNIENQIYPLEPVKEEIRIRFLWANKVPECVERSYTIERESFMAFVTKSGYPITECPEPVRAFLNTYHGDNRKAGGVVSLGPKGKIAVMDFNDKVKFKGQTNILEFPQEDLKRKKFKLICREDALSEPDPKTKRTTSLAASIVNAEFEDIVLERFELTSCDLSNMNINRQIIKKQNRFRVVFKTTDGVCYERDLEFEDINHYFYYNLVTVSHKAPRPVRCPKKFVGDIEKNAYRPWYARLFRFLTGRSKIRYAVEKN